MVESTVVLAAFAATIVLGFLGQVFFRLTRVSDIIILMAFGFGLASLVTGFDPAPFRILAPVIGSFALLIILFEGGLDLHFRELVSGLGRATLLAVLGFTLSTLAVAALGVAALGLDPMRGILLGAILGGSSSIAVMPVVKRLAVNPKSRVVLGVESALTDILCVMGALTLVELLALGSRPDAQNVGRQVAAGFAIAIGIALVVAPLWLKLIDALRALGNIYMLTVAAIFVLFLGVEEVGGNGAIAVLVFGIVLGNARSLRKVLGLVGQAFGHDLRQFQSEVAFVVRAFFFVYLGLIFDRSALVLDVVLKAAAIVLALMLARAVAVWLSAAGSRTLRADRAVWWILMPRGLAAAVLAGVPVAAGVENTESFVAYATLVIVFTNLLGSLAGLFARRGPAETQTEVAFEPEGELGQLFDERLNPHEGQADLRSFEGAPAADAETPTRSRGHPPR